MPIPMTPNMRAKIGRGLLCHCTGPAPGTTRPRSLRLMLPAAAALKHLPAARAQFPEVRHKAGPDLLLVGDRMVAQSKGVVLACPLVVRRIDWRGGNGCGDGQ